MAKKSAGIVLYRFRDKDLQIFLVHPGGPYWKNKDRAAWSIPKGEIVGDEDPLETAKREFEEETGVAPAGPFFELGQLRQPSGKIVHAWAAEGDCDAGAVKSNTFEMEWPPKSGKSRSFPEVDRASWFSADEAGEKLHKGQRDFVSRLREKLGLSR